ncbi:MAG: hypothetical protein AB8I08_27120 [Sandaracinaceae bacterium]
MIPPLSFVDRNEEVQRLPLRFLVFVALTERGDTVQLLEETRPHAVQSEADLLRLTDRPSAPLRALVGALPPDKSVLLDLVDTGPLDLMVDLSEVASVTQSAPFRMSRVGYGYGNEGPHGVWVVDPAHSRSNPIGRATWSMLGDAARQCQCVVIANATTTTDQDNEVMQGLDAAEVLVPAPKAGALSLATKLVQECGASGLRGGLLDRTTTMSGASLAEVLFKQAVTRLLIMRANAARFGGHTFDLNVLLGGEPPLCRRASISIEGGLYRPDARFTLEGVAHPRWNGQEHRFFSEGRFER